MLKRPSCWRKPPRPIKSPKPGSACKKCRSPGNRAAGGGFGNRFRSARATSNPRKPASKRAVKLDPKCSDAYSALGNWYVAQKDLKQAEPAFKTAAELAPPRSGKALQYAQFKIMTGDSAAGKQLLEDLVKKTPDYLPAWIDAGPTRRRR